MKTMKMGWKKIFKALQQIRRIITKILRDHIHETSSCLEVDIAGRVWVLISPMASSSCHHDDPTVPCHTILDLILLFWSWFMIYTKVGNRYLSDVPILTRMMIIGWGFLQSIGQRLKESKIPIIKFLTVPCKVHLVGKWDNGQKRRRRSLQRKSLFTNDLIRKGLRRSFPTYFQALQPFNCLLCMSIKLVASNFRKLWENWKSGFSWQKIQIDVISHKDETCNAELGWAKKVSALLPHFMYY